MGAFRVYVHCAAGDGGEHGGKNRGRVLVWLFRLLFGGRSRNFLRGVLESLGKGLLGWRGEGSRKTTTKYEVKR